MGTKEAASTSITISGVRGDDDSSVEIDSMSLESELQCDSGEELRSGERTAVAGVRVWWLGFDSDMIGAW